MRCLYYLKLILFLLLINNQLFAQSSIKNITAIYDVKIEHVEGLEPEITGKAFFKVMKIDKENDKLFYEINYVYNDGLEGVETSGYGNYKKGISDNIKAINNECMFSSGKQYKKIEFYIDSANKVQACEGEISNGQIVIGDTPFIFLQRSLQFNDYKETLTLVENSLEWKTIIENYYLQD